MGHCPGTNITVSLMLILDISFGKISPIVASFKKP